jgi:DNA-directed RNA polymerase sigma subunit (sigma70/sigma32)
MISLESIYQNVSDGFRIRDTDHALRNYLSFTRQKRNACSDEAPDAILLAREMSVELYDLLSLLPPSAKEIINEHFGFNGTRQSLCQIGRKRGITKQAVHKNLSKALKSLRRMIEQKETGE